MWSQRRLRAMWDSLRQWWVAHPPCPVCGRAMASVAAPPALGQGQVVTCRRPACVFYRRPFRVTRSGLELLRLSPLDAQPARIRARA